MVLSSSNERDEDEESERLRKKRERRQKAKRRFEVEEKIMMAKQGRKRRAKRSVGGSGEESPWALHFSQAADTADRGAAGGFGGQDRGWFRGAGA